MKLKKLILILVCLIWVCPLYANNKTRIEDLQKQLQEITRQITQAQQFIQQKQIEGVKVQGAIEELQRQDKQEEALKKEREKDDDRGTSVGGGSSETKDK